MEGPHGSGRLGNLPVELTSFIGRQREMVAVKRLLGHARLVTLTGTGGSGKTRLALKIAKDLFGEYPDGIWLVELAAITDPSLVPQALASALGLREGKGASLLQTLVDHLAGRKLLLVLDNCEHLIEASAVLVHDLLRACPDVRVLATSRETLGVAGELAWRVPPLSLSDEAVRLFVERAAAALPGFSVADQDWADVAKICRRLEGLPLALELAAAQVRVLSVSSIASRLDDRFRLLTGGNRTSLPRHQTLRAAVDWSYDLLNDQERILWQRLSVFAGSFTLEAAESVCSDQGIEQHELLPLIAQLVNKSLVVVDAEEGEARYRLLQMIRQYGEEKLCESGFEAVGRRKHLDWYLGHAERLQWELDGLGQAAALESMHREYDNLRAALRWSIVSGQAEDARRLSTAVARYWLVRGNLTEGRRWLDDALQLSPRHTPSRAMTLNKAASFAWAQGDYSEAATLCQEAMEIARESGDWHGLGETLGRLGGIWMEQGEYAGAQALFEEALELWRGLNVETEYAATLNNLGALAGRSSDYDRAESLFQAALVIARRLDEWQLVAWVLNNLGFMLRDRGDYPRAGAMLEEGLAMSRRLADTRGIARALQGQGLLAGLQGDYQRATALLQDGLRLDWETGNKRGMVLAVEGLARVAMMQGHWSRAAQLYAGVDRLRESMGLREMPVARGHREEQAKAINAVSTALGPALFSSVWAAGRALAVAQLVESALEPSSPEPPAGEQAIPSPQTGEALLSPREAEIAGLVAGGFTVRQIAARLNLSPLTVKKHEENIRAKLRVKNRAGLAAWAVRRELGGV